MYSIAEVNRLIDQSMEKSWKRRIASRPKHGNSAPIGQRIIGAALAATGLVVIFMQVFELHPSFVWLGIGVFEFVWGLCIERDV